MNSAAIPESLKEIIDVVIADIDKTCVDWFLIKKTLVNRFPPKERSRFSRRHNSSKKHLLNEFDHKVINYWESQTGTKLVLEPSKLHPTIWNPKSRGWGLIVYNESRRMIANTGKKEI